MYTNINCKEKIKTKLYELTLSITLKNNLIYNRFSIASLLIIQQQQKHMKN